MSRRNCPSCGAAFTRGVRVLRITPSGATRSVVCKSCAKLATRVLASDAPNLCQNCQSAPARVCLGCIAELLHRSGHRVTPPARAQAEPEEWDDGSLPERCTHCGAHATGLGIADEPICADCARTGIRPSSRAD